MGQCGSLDCFSPPAPSPIPTSSIPSGLWCRTPFLGAWGVGQSLGPAPGQSMCSPRGGSVLESLTWSQEHPAAPVLAAFPTQTAGCLGQPLPSLLWDVLWLLVLPTPLGQGSIQGCLTQLLGCCRVPLSPQPCPCVLRVTPRAAGAVHSPGFQGCPSSSLTFNPQGRGSWGMGGVGAAGAGSRPHMELGLAAPEAARVKIKGRSCPGAPGQSGNSFHTLRLWFIRKGVRGS